MTIQPSRKGYEKISHAVAAEQAHGLCVAEWRGREVEMNAELDALRCVGVTKVQVYRHATANVAQRRDEAAGVEEQGAFSRLAATAGADCQTAAGSGELR